MQSFLGMLNAFADKVAAYVSIPNISISTVDIIEILIISVLFYHVLVWIKDTRAWNLFKGIVIILIFVLIAAFFQMNTKVKTGALIVVEDSIKLDEYVRTGIDVDGLLTSQLLINIFEKNTPLHDGAVIVRGDRVVSATCYLPLSDSLNLSKDLGTRHRAAVGISEVSDSLTIVVSEETGKVSIAMKGRIYHDVDADFLRKQLQFVQNKTYEAKGIELLRRRLKNEKKSSKISDQ